MRNAGNGRTRDVSARRLSGGLARLVVDGSETYERTEKRPSYDVIEHRHGRSNQ
jgi:hypothetical protein